MGAAQSQSVTLKACGVKVQVLLFWKRFRKKTNIGFEKIIQSSIAFSWLPCADYQLFQKTIASVRGIFFPPQMVANLGCYLDHARLEWRRGGVVF